MCSACVCHDFPLSFCDVCSHSPLTCLDSYTCLPPRVQGTDPGTVVLQAEVVCDYKTVWRELCNIYDEVQTQEELLRVSKIVLPHLFCSETRTIAELARLTDENGEYMPLTLIIEDVESGTAQGSSVAVVHAVLGTHLRAFI